MKTKLEMAHEYLLRFSGTTVADAWQYADAMQAEANKREKEDAAQRRKEIREMLNAPNTFVEREGQHFDDVANQKRTPKVSRFERSDAVKEVLSRAENMGLIKPKAIEEWQPDWSQAPDTATHWTMRTDGKCLWWKGKPLFDGSCFYDAAGICHAVGYAPSFGYTGDWRESLRKRHE